MSDQLQADCEHEHIVDGYSCSSCGWWKCGSCDKYTNRTHFKQRAPGVPIMDHIGIDSEDT